MSEKDKTKNPFAGTYADILLSTPTKTAGAVGTGFAYYPPSSGFTTVAPLAPLVSPTTTGIQKTPVNKDQIIAEKLERIAVALESIVERFC